MSSAIRWIVVGVLALHGAIHFLGVAKGFGLAEVSELKQPIGTGAAVAWLVSGVLVLVTAVMVAAGRPSWWWALAGGAAVLSQAVVATSWQDAKAGTLANLALVLVATYGFLSLGPTSLQHDWEESAAAALEAAPPARRDVVTRSDLDGLPPQLAAYVERSGALGRPHVSSFFATIHGRIRSGPDSAWMPFTGRQLNTYGPMPRRLFHIDAQLKGLPTTVLHVFDEHGATMRGKVLSLVPVVDAAGPVMDRSETVTLFNDMVLLAPGALVDAPVRWRVLGPDRVRAQYTRADQTVTAELVFGADGELVDFVSDDRSRASQDGESFTRLRWHTPVDGYGQIRGRRVVTAGDGKWYADPPEGHFSYVEFHVDDIAYDVRASELPEAGSDVLDRPVGAGR